MLSIPLLRLRNTAHNSMHCSQVLAPSSLKTKLKRNDMERNERDLKGQSVGCSSAWHKSLGDGQSISKLLKMLEPNCAVQLDKFTQFGRMLPSPRNTSKHNTSTEARELLQFLNDPSLLKDGTINDKVGQTIQNLYATACLKASTLLFAHFF